MKFKVSKSIALGFGILLSVLTTRAQDVKWTIVTPESNAIISNENLFASLAINNPYSFDENTIRVFLDGVLITPLLRVNAGRLSFVYESRLPDGKHQVEIKAIIKELKRAERFSWYFFVNTREEQKTDSLKNAGPALQKEKWTVSGTFFADNRNEYISGSGKALRQEPSYTRSAGLDMQIRHKNVTIPVKVFITSDNRFTAQTQNYYQAGFRNKWVELDVGDMNPAIDRLVLTGVRLRGVRAMLKLKANSIQFFYGNMNDAYEGRLEKYMPGAGILPTNLINDSLFVVPGIYKRKMMALRLEFGGRRGNVRAGVSALKVKDDTNSIRYGFQPKENFVTGGDIVLKFIKKMIVLNAGVAASIITNDISYGVFDPKKFETFYGFTVHFDPHKIEKLMIINTSTVPISSHNRDFLSYYSQLSFNNRFQSFNFEYRKNGGLYYSLGNPFLRNNYNGFSVSERVSLLKRKITANGNYQKFSTNLNAGFASKVNSNVFNGGLFINPGDKAPNFFVNYLQQNRDGQNIVKNIPVVKDKVQNMVFTTSMNVGGKKVNNNVRATFNYNARNDRLRPETKTSMYNYLAGWAININTRYSFNADLGKLIIKDNSGNKIANTLSYSLFAQWQAGNQKFYASCGASNNKTFATQLLGPSSRLSVNARTGFKFWKGMALDFEGAIQPYREELNTINNFTEKYIFVRYTYNFGSRSF